MLPPGSNPITDCPQCARLRLQLDAANARIAALEAGVKDLQARLGRNSSNSSTPPSADPPDAPKPTKKAPTGRRRGGQRGHPGHHRPRLPDSRVDRVEDFIPATCCGCRSPLPAEPGPHDPPPSWHQVAELPLLAAIVTEYRAHARTCPGCGTTTHAAIPEDIRSHVIGPRLAAAMSYFSARFHLSKRAIEELVESLFNVPISTGTISALERQTSEATAAAHDQARDAVGTAPVKNVDETGWKLGGARAWLWTAATETVAFFVVHAHRGKRGLVALLGEVVPGVVITDRWAAYNRLPLERRQVCWAHLARDFTKCGERGGAGVVVADTARVVIEDLFTSWRDFRQRRIDRETLVARLDPLVEELRAALEVGSGCADGKVAAFCSNLLGLYPALWLFAKLEGVEPTNNHAERLLRSGVLWRKNSFGSQSEWGCRFVARLLTVVQTLRLQKRSVLEFLVESVVAYRARQPGPALIVPPTA